jgi:hypothetical protein
MDEDFEDFLAEDKRQHPNCNYSFFSQRQCKSVNGSSVCEVVKRVNRICPGERPVEVISRRTQEDGASGSHASSGLGMGSDLPDLHHFMDPFSLFDHFLRGIDSSMQPRGGGHGNYGRGQGLFPVEPPHRYPVGNESSSNEPGRRVSGRVSGPIEKI